MKKHILTLFASLSIAVTSQAQVYQYGGHKYINLGFMSFVDARTHAASLGGHLLVVNDAAEYSFIDSSLIKKGGGWYWSGIRENGGDWIVDGGSIAGVFGIMNNHWNGTTSQSPVGTDAVVVIGKLQITYRSTRWVAKFYQFNSSFASSQVAQTIVEIE